jgi:hypothetical protein
MPKLSFDDICKKLAATVPDHNGKSFSPPMVTYKNPNGNITLVGCDGRKYVFTPEMVNQVIQEKKQADDVKPVIAPKIQVAEAPKLMGLPTHRPSSQEVKPQIPSLYPPENLKPNGKRKSHKS